MNDLLRLANELIEARANAPIGTWENNKYTTDAGDGRSIFYDDERLNRSSEFIVIAGNHAVDIIKGYQELVRRMIAIQENPDAVGDDFDRVLAEAKAALPS